LRQSGIGLVEHAVPLVKIMEEPGQLMGIKSEKVRGQVLRGISNNLRELVELLDERKFLEGSSEARQLGSSVSWH
jgi:hypothetical protein